MADCQKFEREFSRGVADRLQIEYLKQRPLYTDLLDGLGSVDSFVVDGDALLLESLANPHTDLRHGGQPLHLTYLIEDFIHSLNDCLNARFSFVFFENHASIWEGNAFLRLFRRTLQHHLKALAHQRMHTFPSWHSEQWLNFVSESHPAFVLMSDMEGQAVLGEQHRLLVRQMMQAYALHNLSVHLPVAFLAELRFQQDLVFGFKATHLFCVRNTDSCKTDAQALEQHVHRQLLELTQENPVNLSEDLAQKQFPGTAFSKMSGVKACAHLLTEASGGQPGPSNLDSLEAALKMSWAWCLQHAACSALLLEQRSINVERLEIAFAARDGSVDREADAALSLPLAAFIDQWCAVVCHLMVHAGPNMQLVQPSDTSLPDLFDGRLWHFMFHCINMDRATGLSAHSLQAAKGLMTEVCHLAGVTEAEVPMVVDRPSSSGGSIAAIMAPHQQAHGADLMNAAPMGRAEQIDAEEPAAQELQRFEDVYHWHTGRYLEPAYIGETQQHSILAQYRTADMDAMASCPYLTRYQQRHLRKVISQESNPRLWHHDPAERSRRMSSALQQAHGWLGSNLQSQDQKHSRFLRNYADTLSSTKYCLPAAPSADVGRAGRGGSAKRGVGRGGRSSSNRGSARGVKGSAVNGADAIRQKNTARSMAREQQNRDEAWQQQKSKMEKHAQSHSDGWDSYVSSTVNNFLAECDTKPEGTSTVTFLAAAVFRIEGEMKAWKQACQKAGALPASTFRSTADFHHAINLWLHVQDLLEREHIQSLGPEVPDATRSAVKKALKQCVAAMQLLGFSRAAELTQGQLTALGGPQKSRPGSAAGHRSRPGSAAAAAGQQPDFFHVGMNEAEFQLRFCGDVLWRDVPAQKDSRVESFVPDDWQCKVMDAIDARASCVICAPTSSGKTFISSFCIDRVMRESSDGVVVFVAPTKALVNQTAAQVTKDQGVKVGVFTRDFRYEELTSRVLITVPACLEILLFSSTPSHRIWVKRLRYVIFDEVHCMREGGIKESGAAESSGAIWEHCLLLIRCPLLALSATIGNPQQVTGWLRDVKALQQQQDQQAGICRPAASYTVQLVQHAQRYADLRLHRYSHSVQEHQDAAGQLQKLHPCAVLAAKQLEGGMPSQITLEPADCLELFGHMAATVQKRIDEQGKNAFQAQYAAQDHGQLDRELQAVITGVPPSDTMHAWSNGSADTARREPAQPQHEQVDQPNQPEVFEAALSAAASARGPEQHSRLPGPQVQRHAAQDVRERQRELDMQTDQDILQARIDTAENLPLGPGEWQHDDAVQPGAAEALREGDFDPVQPEEGGNAVAVPALAQDAERVASLPGRQVQRQAPQDDREQRELDMHTEQHILQARIDTAENLPLGPGEWQHDDAVQPGAAEALHEGNFDPVQSEEGGSAVAVPANNAPLLQEGRHASDEGNAQADERLETGTLLDNGYHNGQQATDLKVAAEQTQALEAAQAHWLLLAHHFMQRYSPDAYFAQGQPIMRRTVRDWERALKAVFASWAGQHSAYGLAAAAEVLQQLKQGSGWRSRNTRAGDAAARDHRITAQGFHDMLRDLEQKDMLPIITFSFSRTTCGKLAEGLLNMLTAEEVASSASLPSDDSRQRRAAHRAEQDARRTRDRQSSSARDAEAAQYDAQQGPEAADGFAVDPAFSFAGHARHLRGGMTQDVLREHLERAGRQLGNDHFLILAMRRGIGVHHSELPLKYRQVVEILFRTGFLRVVIATGTLAYGINMPCRTVAFAGDHMWLNPLQFRQMSGRAGRRGFDTLGHVIFWNVPQRKCTSLLVSPVPDLHGNFPLTISLALRAVTLQNAAAVDPEVKNDVLRLLQKPFFAAEDPTLGARMQHIFSYALVYLRRQAMLNAAGQSVAFAGLAAHIFWCEPANFAFVTLLRREVFHNICAAGQGVRAAQQRNGPVPKAIARNVLLVLSHLFERVLLKRSVAQDDAIRSSTSRVVLESLPSEVRSVLEEHNAQALDDFLTYIRNFILASGAALPPANVLPVSKLSYPMVPEPTTGQHNSISITGGALRELKKQQLIASPFVALSGQGEEFRSVEEAVQSLRPGVLFNTASVPSMRNTDRHGQAVPLNRYILDFWGHGQKQALAGANGMREGDAWQHLKTFIGILKAIATAMAEMVRDTDQEDDPVVWTFQQLAKEFQVKHHNFNCGMSHHRNAAEGL